MCGGMELRITEPIYAWEWSPKLISFPEVFPLNVFVWAHKNVVKRANTKSKCAHALERWGACILICSKFCFKQENLLHVKSYQLPRIEFSRTLYPWPHEISCRKVMTNNVIRDELGNLAIICNPAKKNKLVQGSQGIAGTGRLSSRCPSTVK